MEYSGTPFFMPILSIIDDGFYKRFRITVSFALYTKHIRSIYAVLMARWPAFSTAQHYRDHGADRLHQKNRKRKCFVLRINGKNILDWFRKQFERLLQQYSNHNEKTRNSNCNDYKYLCANIKNAGNVIALPTFFIFLHLERGSSLQDILEFEEALCLSCGWEPRKFAIVHKDSIVVLTHIAWAAIPISVYKVFLGPPTRTWHAVSRFYVEWPPERLREVNLFEIL